MGAFDRKKTYVFTQVQPIFDNTQMGDPVQEAIYRSLVWGSDIFDEYMYSVKNGFHVNVDAAYRYAKNGNYIHGTPNLQHFGQQRFKQASIPILRSLFGPLGEVEHFQVGELNPVFAGLDYVYNQLGYNQTTNKIDSYSTAVGHDCFLYDILGHYVQTDRNQLRIEDSLWAGHNPQSGKTPSRQFEVTYAEPLSPPTLGSIDGFEVIYEWVDVNGEIQQASDLVDISSTTGEDYFQAVVRVFGGGLAIWKYRIGTGVFPSLDALANSTFTGTGDYFPFIPFRANRQDLTAEGLRVSPEYLSTKALVKKLGMDYQSISDQIHASPDINDIEQAIMTLAVKGDTDDQSDLEYLFKFFQGFSELGFNTEIMMEVTHRGSYPTPVNTSLLRWADAGFEVRLNAFGIKKRVVAGNITPVGTFKLLKGTTTFKQYEQNLSFIRDGTDTDEFILVTKTVPVYKYCYQNNPYLFTAIEIINPSAEYPVTGALSTTFYADEEQFIIPVDMNYVKTMPWKTRHKFYTRNLQFVFNSKIVQKLKWYETFLFRAVVAVIAFVSAVFGLYEVGRLLINIVGASSVTAALSIAGTFLQKLLILKLIGIAVVNVVGEQYALIVDALMLALAAADAVGGGNLPLPTLISPELLLGLASGIQDAVQSSLKDAFAKYDQMTRSFLEDMTEKMDELAQLKKDLNFDLLDSPFVDKYKVPMTIPGETPEQYFNRTIHSGNVGTLAYKTVENFVSNSLKLPNINRDPRLEVTIYG